jgi:hypothetical protein
MVAVVDNYVFLGGDTENISKVLLEQYLQKAAAWAKQFNSDVKVCYSHLTSQEEFNLFVQGFATA